jgi:hypothetical protein
MRFAKWVFNVAGVYGLVVLAPMYFMEAKIGRDSPPPVTHPEFFYGFIGVALAWQILFLIIAQDTARLRPAIPAAVVEKITFAVAVPILYAQGRVSVSMLGAASIDAVLAILFVIAYLRTRVISDARP